VYEHDPHWQDDEQVCFPHASRQSRWEPAEQTPWPVQLPHVFHWQDELHVRLWVPHQPHD
jgi:hypothetical protein